MARNMNNKTKRFALEDSDAIEENERILEAGSQKRKENREAEQAASVPTSAPVVQEPALADAPAPSFATNGKKTANGIVVNVPMEDYMQLTMMKFQTGRTLKDLALQAIHEFVERNK